MTSPAEGSRSGWRCGWGMWRPSDPETTTRTSRKTTAARRPRVNLILGGRGKTQSSKKNSRQVPGFSPSSRLETSISFKSLFGPIQFCWNRQNQNNLTSEPQTLTLVSFFQMDQCLFLNFFLAMRAIALVWPVRAEFKNYTTRLLNDDSPNSFQ